MTKPKPGDFAVVGIKGLIGKALTGWQQLMKQPEYAEYGHALIYIGSNLYVEAMLEGVTVNEVGAPIHDYYTDYLWSTDRIPLADDQREDIVGVALDYVGTPYNYLEWMMQPAHAFNLWPNVWPAVASNRVLMCSQLVAQVYADAGMPLCGGRWPGYVTPSALAAEIHNN